MSNRAAQIRAAILAERPRAVVSGRGRNWIRHTDPDTGRHILTSTVGDLHYTDNGWQEIDTTVQPSTDAAFDDEITQAPYRVRVKDGNRRVWPRRDVADEYIDFGRPEFRRNNGQYAVIPWNGRRREDNAVVFFRNDAELRVSFAAGRLKMNLVLLAQPASTHWRFPVSITGLTRQGARLVSNRDGTTVATLAPFELDDAAGEHRDIARTFTTHPTYQGAYVVQPDLSGLTYPVVIDPTIDTSVGASGDDGRWRSGSFSSIDDDTFIGGGANNNGFFRFTGLTALDGATVSAAKLTFVAAATDNDAANFVIKARAADNPAAPTTESAAGTATRHATTVPWSSVAAWTAGTAYDSPDITTLIQALVDDGYLASGVILFYVEPASSGTGQRDAASYDHATYNPPALHVEYSSSQTVNPARLDAPATFYAPTIDEVVDVPARLDAGATFYAPSLGEGVYPARLDAGTTFYQPTVTEQVNLDRFDAAATFYAPAITEWVEVPARLDAAATFYQPTTAEGVTPDRLDAGATFYQPTITERVNVSGRFDAAATFYQPTAAEGIAPSRLDAPATFYALTITERVNVGERFDAPATFYQPTAAYAAPRTGLLYTRIMQADDLRVTADSSLALTITDSPVRLSTNSSSVRIEADAAPLRIRPE